MFGKKDGTSLKGKQHGIVNKLWKELKKRERAGELIAVPIDEYLSLQVSIWSHSHAYGYSINKTWLDLS